MNSLKKSIFRITNVSETFQTSNVSQKYMFLFQSDIVFCVVQKRGYELDIKSSRKKLIANKSLDSQRQWNFFLSFTIKIKVKMK